MTKKIIIIVVSVIVLAALAGAIAWGVINFNKVKDGMSGAGLYNETDVTAAYEDGYNNALEDKTEYETLINGYRDSITEMNDMMSQLNSQIAELTGTNGDLNSAISALQSQKAALESTVKETNAVMLQLNERITGLNTVNDGLSDDLAAARNQITVLNGLKTDLDKTVAENKTTIARLETQVLELQGRINELTLIGTDKDNEIALLKSEIAGLNNIVTQLQTANDTNLTTITTLNQQIAMLNENVVSLLTQQSMNANTIGMLNSQITDLQESVTYYEQLIAAFQSEGKAIVTFMYDNAVYNMQVVDRGSAVNVAAPTSTEYITFHGWTVDGVNTVDPATYTVTENTVFTAVLSYVYDVRFIYEGTEYNKQTVAKDGFAVTTAPESTTYKEFKGWSVDGNTLIDITAYPIMAHTVFYAVVVYRYDVTFWDIDGTVYDSQIVGKDGFAAVPKEPKYVDTTGLTAFEIMMGKGLKTHVFKGWAVDGEIVDVSTYAVTENTTFTAAVNKMHKVEYKNAPDDVSYFTEYIENGQCIETVKLGYADDKNFLGWSFDGFTFMNISAYVNYPVVGDTVFIAVWEPKTWQYVALDCISPDATDSGKEIVFTDMFYDTVNITDRYRNVPGDLEKIRVTVRDVRGTWLDSADVDYTVELSVNESITKTFARDDGTDFTFTVKLYVEDGKLILHCVHNTSGKRGVISEIATWKLA